MAKTVTLENKFYEKEHRFNTSLERIEKQHNIITKKYHKMNKLRKNAKIQYQKWKKAEKLLKENLVLIQKDLEKMKSKVPTVEQSKLIAEKNSKEENAQFKIIEKKYLKSKSEYNQMKKWTNGVRHQRQRASRRKERALNFCKKFKCR